MLAVWGQWSQDWLCDKTVMCGKSICKAYKNWANLHVSNSNLRNWAIFNGSNSNFAYCNQSSNQRRKNFNVWHCMQTFQPVFSYLPCLYRHHWFLPFYTTVTALDLGWAHKVSAKQNLLASFSPTLCNWSEWNWIWCFFEGDLLKQGK